MRILHLIASVDPKGGGPIEYARIVADAHATAGHESVFVTLDNPADLNAFGFAHPVHATGPVRGVLKSSQQFARTVAQQAARSDVAVVHGLWNHAAIGGYRALRNAGLPWVVFPHGMMDPYFRRIKPVKHWLKTLYWVLWQGRMLSGSKAVLFTCEEEQRLAKGGFPLHQEYRGKVVAFCSADQGLAAAEISTGQEALAALWPTADSRPYWLFLSRIHPKKAIDTLIVAYARLAVRPDCPDLVIAGPDTMGWQAALQSLAAAQGVGERVHFPGMLGGATKAAAFAGAKAFVLPSHQENFGLVVAEALSVGTPVLLSDKVNIWREVVEAGAGLAEPDTVDGTARLLARFLDLTEAELATMKAAARPCYDTHFSPKAAAEDLLAVLESTR